MLCFGPTRDRLICNDGRTNRAKCLHLASRVPDDFAAPLLYLFSATPQHERKCDVIIRKMLHNEDGIRVSGSYRAARGTLNWTNTKLSLSASV